MWRAEGTLFLSFRHLLRRMLQRKTNVTPNTSRRAGNNARVIGGLALPSDGGPFDRFGIRFAHI